MVEAQDAVGCGLGAFVESSLDGLAAPLRWNRDRLRSLGCCDGLLGKEPFAELVTGDDIGELDSGGDITIEYLVEYSVVGGVEVSLIDEVREDLVVNKHAFVESAGAAGPVAGGIRIFLGLAGDPRVCKSLVIEIELPELGPAGIVVQPNV